jgi:hypothetical protein
VFAALMLDNSRTRGTYRKEVNVSENLDEPIKAGAQM